jgi:hypothetical protein
VTILHGNRDAAAPLNVTGRRFAAWAPGAELVIHEGAAHGLMLPHGQRLVADLSPKMKHSGPG